MQVFLEWADWCLKSTTGRQGLRTLWSADDWCADPGQAGKGNAVLNFGPGKLSMDNSQLPLQLTGDEAKQADLILYARLLRS